MRLNQNSTFNRFGNGQKDEITSDKQIDKEKERLTNREGTSLLLSYRPKLTKKITSVTK